MFIGTDIHNNFSLQRRETFAYETLRSVGARFGELMARGSSPTVMEGYAERNPRV